MASPKPSQPSRHTHIWDIPAVWDSLTAMDALTEQATAVLIKRRMRIIYELEQKVKSEDLEVTKREMPCIGYRIFAVSPDTLALHSINLSFGTWNESGTTEAQCKSMAGMGHAWGFGGWWSGSVANASANYPPPNLPHPDVVSPHQYCECGLYVLTSMDRVKAWIGSSSHHNWPHVIAAVMGWGKVIRHAEEGWRAQYARPIAFLDKELLRYKTGFTDKDPIQLQDLSETMVSIMNSLSERYQVPILNEKWIQRYANEFGSKWDS